MDTGKKTRLYEFGRNQLRGLRRMAAAGDLHGDYDALSSLLRAVDLSQDCIIFLGDYADRGPNGVEVIDKVNSMIHKYPLNVVALKGNHEDYSESGSPNFSPCTLISEVESKGEDWSMYFQEKLKPFSDSLYLAATIPDESLFVHGGISSRIRSLSDLRHPSRKAEIDVLWSDPSDGVGERPNRRGEGVEFGKDITSNACRLLGVKRIIRSHEPTKAYNGPYYEHDGKVITTSCTSIYGGKPFLLIADMSSLSTLSTFLL